MAATETTTPSRPKPPRRLGVKAVSLVTGLALVVLAAPRLSSEFDLLTAAAVPLSGMEREKLDRLAATMEISTEGASRSRALNLAAQARLEAARVEGFGSPQGLADLRLAADDQSRALRRSPVDAYGWGRLAHAEFASGRLLEAVHAWRMSYLTGRFDPDLLPSRTEAGFALWRYMDLEARDAMRDVLLTHRAWDADGLAALVYRFGAHAILSQSLRQDPEALADVDARIRRLVGLPR